jgi:hypothetical protein
MAATMAKQPTKRHLHSWAVHHIKGTPAKLVGTVYDQPLSQLSNKRSWNTTFRSTGAAD